LAKQVLRVHYLLQDGPPVHSDGLADFRTEILNATKNINLGRQDNWGGREKIEQARRAMAAVRELAQNLLGELNTLATQYSEETVEVAAAIWAEAAAALQAWRNFEAAIPALDFEDVQIRLRDLLRSDAEVRRALQTRFRHILVDEFQDTDGLQRDLVWLLAGLQQGVEGNGRVFVVGDAKQSIYRFRNADVKVFTDACRQFEEDSGARRERLTATFRAHSGLVDFFNALFCNPGVMGSTATERFEVAYEPMQALREPIGDGPWVFGMLALARPGEASVLQRVAEAELIARTVRQLLDAAPPVYDHGSSSYRTLGPGDVAILFRAATDVHIYEEELEKLGVPYYNAAGRGFYTRPEVADLINLAKAVANPDDAIALVSVLRSPMFALSDATLFWLAQARGTWWDRLTDAPGAISSGREPYCHVAAEEHERLRLAADLFSQWRAVYDRVPVSSLLEAAVEQTGYSAAMAALPAGERRVANIHKLLDYARDFDRAGRGGLMAFAEELMLLAKQNAKEEQAPTEEEHGDSVRLSTVHGAKGLQWPVVIVADLNRREVTGTSSLTRMHPEYGIVPAEVGAQPERLWRLIGEVVKRANDAEEAAENKRLLYVALTRASEILIMSSGLGMGDENKLEAPAKDSWLGRLLDGCGVTLPDKLDCSAEGQLTPVSAAEGLCPWFVVPRDAEFRLSWLQNLPRTARQEPEAEETLQPPVDLSAALARIPPDTGARRRFTVTELARYLQCPRYYWLRYVEGLPDCACPPGISRAGMSALEIGNLAHHLLRMVGTGGSQALDNLLRPVLPGGRQVKFLDDRTRETLRSLLEWYLEHRFYEENLVGARLRTEAPLTFPLDRALIEGKVDAVAEKNGDLVVIDYKTGLASESEQGELEDEGTVDADRFQVALYSYGLYTVTGRWPREAVVVYLRQPGRFEHVSLPREGLEAAERAGQAVAEITGQLRGLPPPRVEYGCSGCGLGWACEDREVSTRRGV
ncbi:MAG: UvrD-helicase domain-containing protein, partial [Armatimonadetes bacterium]|nr:UvrD-helicase domain-containing protein [Armatimonadota bacterium]